MPSVCPGISKLWLQVTGNDYKFIYATAQKNLNGKLHVLCNVFENLIKAIEELYKNSTWVWIVWYMLNKQ